MAWVCWRHEKAPEAQEMTPNPHGPGNPVMHVSPPPGLPSSTLPLQSLSSISHASGLGLFVSKHIDIPLLHLSSPTPHTPMSPVSQGSPSVVTLSSTNPLQSSSLPLQISGTPHPEPLLLDAAELDDELSIPPLPLDDEPPLPPHGSSSSPPPLGDCSPMAHPEPGTINIPTKKPIVAHVKIRCSRIIALHPFNHSPRRIATTNAPRYPSLNAASRGEMGKMVLPDNLDAMYNETCCIKTLRFGR
jgi:hypothetical protein